MGIEVYFTEDGIWAMNDEDGELDRIIVEGKHQPIVTKEEFEKVQKLIEEKRPQMEKCRKNRGIHSYDLWRRKLRCLCGHAFAKTR